MKNQLILSVGVAGFALLSLVVSAQAQTYVPDPGHPRVNEVNRREARQQARISNGIASGQLNANEAARLEHREANIQARENRDMAAHNGHLTRRETARLNRAENRTSRSIYRRRHN